MDFSSHKKAEIAFSALRGKQSLEALAKENRARLWQVTDWAIALRQKGYQAFATSSPESQRPVSAITGLPWRTVFIHLPKTAGTTLTTYLEDAYQFSRICPARLHNQLEDLALDKNLASFDLFCGHFFYGWFREHANFVDDTRYVTVLRNPVSRAISYYHHWMREPIRTYRYVSPLICDANVQCMYLSPLDMREAHYSLRDHLNAAKEALETFFFVGIQEQFAESLEILHKALGLAIPAEQRVRNSALGQQLDPLPQQLLDEITDANWADIELYEYAKQLFQRRLLATSVAPSEPISYIPTPQLPATVSFHTLDPLNGSNWHEREGLEHESPWRWSGPGTESSLNFRVAVDKDAEYRVSLHIINAMSPDVLGSITLSINGVAVDIQQARDARNRFFLEGRVLGLDIASNSNTIDVRIRVSHTLSHFDVDPNIDDHRPCGFALSEFHLLPT